MTICKMDANENPYSLPEPIKDEVTRKVSEFNFNRYPDSEADFLKNKLAEYTGLQKNNIMVGNGSDELLSLVMKRFLGNNKKALISVPTFGMYSFYAENFGGGAVSISLKDDFSLDWSQIKVLAGREDIGLIVLCSPNNPTGNIIDFSQLEWLLSNSDKPILLDETYWDFSRKTKIHLINEFSNLIITRTFSKSFSMAGLRLGYLAAGQSLVNKLEQIRSPYNTNSFSQKIACLVLDSVELFQKQWQSIRENRNKLFAKLKDLKGVTPYPSLANFITFNTEKNEKEIYERLKAAGIKIRYFSNLSLCGDTLRVTVGKEKENIMFIENLTKIVEEG